MLNRKGAYPLLKSPSLGQGGSKSPCLNHSIGKDIILFLTFDFNGLLKLKLEVSLVFHMIWNDPVAWLKGEQEGLPTPIVWRNQALLESIFHFYPNAEVCIYSNTLPNSYTETFQTTGYDAKVLRFDLKEWATETPAENQVMDIQEWSEEQDWVVNVSDLLRLLVLYKQGGVYLDFTDTLLLKPIDQFQNAIGWEHHGLLGTGVMIFEKKHPFIQSCIQDYFTYYDASVWANQGPHLATRTFEKSGFLVNFDLPVSAFYPIHWKKCPMYHYADRISSELPLKLIEFIEENTFVLHYYGVSQGTMSDTLIEGSVLDYFISKTRLD